MTADSQYEIFAPKTENGDPEILQASSTLPTKESLCFFCGKLDTLDNSVLLKMPSAISVRKLVISQPYVISD